MITNNVIKFRNKKNILKPTPNPLIIGTGAGKFYDLSFSLSRYLPEFIRLNDPVMR